MKKSKPRLRRCTACYEMKEKHELIRVVRINANGFVVDVSGKKDGRGAYICLDEKCLEKAQKSRGLERSFKSSVPKEIYEIIKDELSTQNG